MQVAEFVAELLLELVNDLRHADVGQDGVVFGAEHHSVGLDRVEANKVLTPSVGRTVKTKELFLISIH